MAEIDRRPKAYLRPEDIDQLARQHIELMAELWITKDRLTLLESVLEKAGLLDRAALDQLVPEGELAAELLRERDAYVARIVGMDHRERSHETLAERGRQWAGETTANRQGAEPS